jgi:hypothetical protein
LLQATRAVVLDHERLRHLIARAELDHQMAATAAAGAGRKIGMVSDGAHRTGLAPKSDLLFAGWAQAATPDFRYRRYGPPVWSNKLA